ncbi:hypothetical protein [Dyella caseinilytica]|uniref:Uncharacterized protein n=1 Tax=Dyella caseinilytica TaxID=1849581 RepID=A0ABX7GQN3_9GAMM|nr:hypothetical protein [Dyella caseinilytica]QRN52575.1 hypothetical protein ISN74_14010 [Dyella caseinilytica]GGA07143.1 hypothetical protein GCM10011408_30310 [Dyella caseinilytica]
MNRRAITALATSLLMTAAWAQTASQPLNLKLPANTPYPGTSANTAQPAHSSTAVPNPSAVTINGQTPSAATPGVYYGDTSGTRGNRSSASAPACDDSTYNQPQVHGDVGMGVVTGSHMPSGSYQSGNVSVVQNTGSCDHPTGAVGISIGVSRFGTFGSGGFGH